VAGTVPAGVHREQLASTFLNYAPNLICSSAQGEQRISNFLLWQLVYTELYFYADTVA
jgi:undecaprenyl diphosphate synthase